MIWVDVSFLTSGYEAFLHHLCQSIRTQTCAPTHQDQAAPSQAQRMNELISSVQTTRPFVLVIDNSHRLVNRSLIADLISLTTRHERFHVIFCGRTVEPFIELATGRVDLTMISGRDLLLDLDETAELADMYEVNIDPLQIHEIAGGWAAPTRLLVEAKSSRRSSLAANYAHSAITTALAEAPALEPGLRLANARRIDLRHVPHLVPDQDPDTLVSMLQATGLCEVIGPPGRRQLVFPKLIHEAVTDLEARRDPGEFRRFQRQLATLLRSSPRLDQISEAFQHAVLGQDFDTSHELFTRHGLSLAASYPGAIRRTLAKIPTSVAVKFEVMAKVAATTRRCEVGEVDQQSAERAVIHTYSQSMAKGIEHLTAIDQILIATAHIVELRMTGGLRQAAELAAMTWERLATDLSRTPAAHERVAWFHLQRGLVHTLLGEFTFAADYLERGWQEGRQTFAWHIAAYGASVLAMIHSIRGDHDQTRLWLDRWAGYKRSDDRTAQIASIGARIAETLLEADRLDLDSARRRLHQLNNDDHNQELAPFLQYLNGQVALLSPDPSSALTILLTTLDGTQPTAWRTTLGGLLAATQANIAMALGRGHSAQTAVSARIPRHPAMHVAAARLCLLSGDPTQAAELVTIALMQSAPSTRHRLELTMIGAVARLRLGDSEAAFQYASEASAIIDHTGASSAWPTIPADDQGTLLKLIGKTHEIADPRSVYPAQIIVVSLTRREKVLLETLAATTSRAELASTLFITVNTVKKQIRSLYRKLGTNDREQTLLVARRIGLIP